MKKSLLISHLFSKPMLRIIILIQLLNFTTTNAENTIKICHESRHFPPYLLKENGKFNGILIDIINSATSEVQKPIEFYLKSWARCKNDVKKGHAQALFAMVSTSKRQQEYAFPPEHYMDKWFLWQAQYVIFTPINAHFDISSYQPTQGIGAPAGYVVWHKLKKMGWLSPYQYEPNDGFNMLAIEKLDGYVIDKFIGLNLIYENKLETKIKITQHTLLNTQWYIAFNKDFYQNNKALVHTFWQSIAVSREIYEQKSKDIK